MYLPYSKIMLTPQNVDRRPIKIDARDIATGLSRQPRFAGHTTRAYSVLQHSLACYHAVERFYAEELRREAPAGVLLHTLLHDAHEAILGDIPSTWKTDERKEMEAKIDRAIFSSFGLSEPNQEEHAMVNVADSVILGAESLLVAGRDEALAPTNEIAMQVVGDIMRWQIDGVRYFLDILAIDLQRKRVS